MPFANEFQCIKIKDGLYLGNNEAAQDYEFLAINKFAYVINCSSQTPNYFESMGIKYLKFKLLKDKPHKLFDQHLKKVNKITSFLEPCEQNSLCCMVTSNQGNMRSLIIIVAYLMSKFRWSLRKTLEYIRAKNIYISLNEHYVQQLEALEEILNSQQPKPALSKNWQGPYHSVEEEIISKTFINSQQIPTCTEVKPKKERKRIQWQDRIDKQKKKALKQQKSKELKESREKSREKSNPKMTLSEPLNRKALTNNFMPSNSGNSQQLSSSYGQLPPKAHRSKKVSQKSNSVNKISLESACFSKEPRNLKQQTAKNVSSFGKVKKTKTEEADIQMLDDEEKKVNHKPIDIEYHVQPSKSTKISKLNTEQDIGESEKDSSRKIQNFQKVQKAEQCTNLEDNFLNRLQGLEAIKTQKSKSERGIKNQELCNQKASYYLENCIPPSEAKQAVYNLTINNFIGPSIKIVEQKGCDNKENDREVLKKQIRYEKKQENRKQKASTKGKQKKNKKKSQHSPGEGNNPFTHLHPKKNKF